MGPSARSRLESSECLLPVARLDYYPGFWNNIRPNTSPGSTPEHFRPYPGGRKGSGHRWSDTRSGSRCRRRKILEEIGRRTALGFEQNHRNTPPDSFPCWAGRLPSRSSHGCCRSPGPRDSCAHRFHGRPFPIPLRSAADRRSIRSKPSRHTRRPRLPAACGSSFIRNNL